MPYIKKQDRKKFDKHINSLIKEIKKSKVENQDGQVDYIITKILKEIYSKNKTFFNLNRAVGVLNSVMLEFYRRVVAPYKNKKIKQHGDVY